MDLTRVMLKRRRTKIVATVGPASSSPEMLAKLVQLGVDVFRLNFSHGTQELHATACCS
jgi:pyruvate kinase